ncbi:ubiquitin carboxyl-terminal hydrolase family protein [Actinidia rufa]|uniref:Ubiquitin carboxyl-terminal hydrolase family protein n=1 Tax=Actinidia rufa TaxID=165716 RepID=A0A7J0H9C8_9ERIC|nr:ubiquitin carboxyl-terminal hydrolase family protein [Actinidia rufa]
MLFSSRLKTLGRSNSPSRVRVWFQFTSSISSLKVAWRKDVNLDQAIENDKQWRLCARVLKEVLNEPGQVIPLRYLEKRRERMRLPTTIKAFLAKNPGLFDTYLDRIKPKTEPVPFICASDRLQRFLDEEKRINLENEPLIVAKLCKLLMMSKDKVERGNRFLELVSWKPEFAKSVIEQRAEEESRLTGIRARPSFDVKLPPGFFLKKEMREWVRDWMELPYISPYDDASELDQASREMEKRTVGVFHELLSLSLFKRIPVPILGKFCEDYRFSNAFSTAFTRHSGIFYLSLKGGIQTAVLREAYKDDKLVDRDPLIEIKDRFVELLAEGHRERAEQLRLRRAVVQKDMEMMALRNHE